jgi:hypothetical protein
LILRAILIGILLGGRATTVVAIARDQIDPPRRQQHLI